MRNPFARPLIWLGAFVFAVGIACGLGGADPTPTAPPVSTEAPPPAATSTTPPTQTPVPTATLVPTLPAPPPTAQGVQIQPTDVPPPTVASNEPPAYYIEEFDGDNSSYSYFVFNGFDGGTEMLYTEGGEIVFNINTQDTWVYVTYDPWIYGDVRIGLSAENRGKNSQRVSLVCRMSEDGWFEFNVGGDGLYEILVYDALNDRFVNLGNGGSTAILLGRNTNEYIVECLGNDLFLYINGTLVKSLTIPNDYRFLTEGYVGFAVSSFDALPVEIGVGWFGIEEP